MFKLDERLLPVVAAAVRMVARLARICLLSSSPLAVSQVERRAGTVLHTTSRPPDTPPSAHKRCILYAYQCYGSKYIFPPTPETIFFSDCHSPTVPLASWSSNPLEFLQYLFSLLKYGIISIFVFFNRRYTFIL